MAPHQVLMKFVGEAIRITGMATLTKRGGELRPRDGARVSGSVVEGSTIHQQRVALACGKPEGSCQSERAAGRSGGAHEAAASGEPPQESVGAREGCKQARQAQLTALPWRLGRGFDSGV